MTDRVSIFDLRLAADWCQSYEPAGDDEDQADVSAIHRVAAWLKAEAEHREQESLIRDTMKRHKLTRKVAIAVIARAIDVRQAPSSPAPKPKPDPFLERIRNRKTTS